MEKVPPPPPSSPPHPPPSSSPPYAFRERNRRFKNRPGGHGKTTEEKDRLKRPEADLHYRQRRKPNTKRRSLKPNQKFGIEHLMRTASTIDRNKAHINRPTDDHAHTHSSNTRAHDTKPRRKTLSPTNQEARQKPSEKPPQTQMKTAPLSAMATNNTKRTQDPLPGTPICPSEPGPSKVVHLSRTPETKNKERRGEGEEEE